jgi:hypothetical protein
MFDIRSLTELPASVTSATRERFGTASFNNTNCPVKSTPISERPVAFPPGCARPSKSDANRVRYKDKHDWNGTGKLFDVDSTDGCHRDNDIGF